MTVADPHWRDYIDAKLEGLARERKTIHVDDLYAVIDRYPDSPNSWGSIWQRAIKRGVLAKTGLSRPTKLPGKHSHEYPVYRSLFYQRPEAPA